MIRITSKPWALTLIGILFALMCAGVYLQVLWTDWAVHEIFKKDFNNFLIYAALLTVEAAAPKSMKGITVLILILMTLYIFLLA